MPVTGDATTFASAEHHYAAARPPYSEACVDYLADRFAVETGCVLDLGCGAGQLTAALADRADAVVGVDPNRAMLEHARDRTPDDADAEWLQARDAELTGLDATFRLATVGRAFHWMDEHHALTELTRLTRGPEPSQSGTDPSVEPSQSGTDPSVAPGRTGGTDSPVEPSQSGGVALVTDTNWFTRGEEAWQDAVYGLVGDYLDDLPERTGRDVEYDQPWDDLLREYGFRGVEERVFEYEREWSADEIVGCVFSLSCSSPARFGGEQAAFERDLRALLDERDGERFVQRVEESVISGFSPDAE